MTKILFCTIGQTPQVVTETVWALLKQNPPWAPDEIHIVTTSVGFKRVHADLRDPKGRLPALFAKFRVPMPPLTVHIPTSDRKSEVFGPLRGRGDWGAQSKVPATSAHALSDVNSQNDAAIMGDLILRLMAGFAADKNSKIHLSLAGGRKTMSAHALLAMTLVGRPGDKVSHVLVSSEDFEDHFGFWHPDQGDWIPTKEGIREALKTGSAATPALDPKNAKITLVETPTPLMRHRVKKPAELEELSLSRLVEELNLATAASARPEVRLDSSTNVINLNGVARKLDPKYFAMYRLLATARKEYWPGSDGAPAGWLSVPKICSGLDPRGRSIEKLYLGYLREAAFADKAADPDSHRSVVEWRDKVVATSDPKTKLRHAQTAIGSNTRLIEALGKEFGVSIAAIIGPAMDKRRQQVPLRGGKISDKGASRFGLAENLPPAAITID